MGVNLNHLPRMRQRETKWSGAPLIRNRHRPERLEVVAERSGDRPSVETVLSAVTESAPARIRGAAQGGGSRICSAPTSP
jgi:hypothetical protein